MRMIPLILLLAFASAVHGAEFNYGSYRPALLSEAVSSFELDSRSDYMIDAAMRKYRVEATFTGKTREVDPGLGRFLAGWAKALNVPSHVPGMFNTAVEIRQGSTTLWMPIQDGLIESFAEEVPAGSSVDVFVLLLGAYDQTPVFVITSSARARTKPNPGTAAITDLARASPALQRRARVAATPSDHVSSLR